MNALITGATGFIGHHLARTLGERGDCVRCLVRPTSDRSKLEGLAGVDFAVGDVAEPSSLEGVAEGCSVVFHLAAEGHVSAVSEEAYRRFAAVNVGGTRNLLEACAGSGVRRFVHFSSTAAMGLIEKPLVNEDDEPQPRTPYQRSKLASEQVALDAARDGGVPATVLRPCMVYGVGGFGEFHKWCRLIHKGLFPRAGLGRNLTPIVHVLDVVQAALLAAKRGRPGEVYLVASARSVPLAELRRYVLEAYGVWRPYWYVPGPLMLLGAWLAEKLAAARGQAPVVTVQNIRNTLYDREFSIEKARRELGYEPSVGLREGIAETVQWFLRQEKGGTEGSASLR
ncbi:MAG: NAD-dependent epimerase/dehydratase family protein [Candidatus Brocadiia bacterium]